MKSQSGFNLIELMVVMAIVAILGAVALPAYQDSVRKSKRTEAKDALLNVAARQERWFIQKNQYVTEADNKKVDAVKVGAGLTENEYYSISLSSVPCGNTSCFTATAQVNAAKYSDDDCYEMVIDSAGRKTAKTKGGVLTESCW